MIQASDKQMHSSKNGSLASLNGPSDRLSVSYSEGPNNKNNSNGSDGSLGNNGLLQEKKEHSEAVKNPSALLAAEPVKEVKSQAPERGLRMPYVDPVKH